MQSKIILAFALALLASCSAPKYSYNFSHYRNDVAVDRQQQPEATFALAAEELTACASGQPAPLATVSDAPVMKKPSLQLSKGERVQLKRELKRSVKEQEKTVSIESTRAAKAMDHDLKLAAIFGAVGVVGLALNGIAAVFGIIGGIAFLIGVVFFVKWIIRQ